MSKKQEYGPNYVQNTVPTWITISKGYKERARLLQKAKDVDAPSKIRRYNRSNSKDLKMICDLINCI